MEDKTTLLKKINSKSFYSGLLQGKAYRTLQNHLTQALKPFSLSIPEWKLLGLLSENDKLRAADLADLMDVDPPLITALVNSLITKKFVQKKSDTKDRRVIFIIATAKGKKIIDDIEPAVRAEMKFLLQGISPMEMMTYMKILQTISENGKSKRIKKNYTIE